MQFSLCRLCDPICTPGEEGHCTAQTPKNNINQVCKQEKEGRIFFQQTAREECGCLGVALKVAAFA